MLDVQAPDHISRKSRVLECLETLFAARASSRLRQWLFAFDQMQQIPVGIREEYQTVSLILEGLTVNWMFFTFRSA